MFKGVRFVFPREINDFHDGGKPRIEDYVYNGNDVDAVVRYIEGGEVPMPIPDGWDERRICINALVVFTRRYVDVLTTKLVAFVVIEFRDETHHEEREPLKEILYRIIAQNDSVRGLTVKRERIRT